MNYIEFRSHSVVGMYPMYYITADNACLCAKCCNENLELVNGTDKQWQVVGYEINWEDQDLKCDHCNNVIETAYSE